MIRRYKAMILNGFEGLLFDAEDAMHQGNKMMWKDLGLPEVGRELKKITELQYFQDKWYPSILQDLMAQSEKKQLMGAPVLEIETKILHANDGESFSCAQWRTRSRST